MTGSPKFIARPEVAELARKVLNILVGINDEISDEALSKMVGEPLKPRSSAMRVALRDLARGTPPIHFRRIRSVGYKRMHDHDLVVHSETDLKKLARGARRGRKRLATVAFPTLSNSDQLQAARNATRFAVIETAAAIREPKAVPAIPELSDVIRRIKEQVV